MTKATLSFRTDEETKARLDALAGSLRRDRSFLIKEAIDQYLELNDWQEAQIRAGIAEVQRGETVPHAEAVAWLRSLDTDDPLPVPEPRRA
ncbi:MAG TPA: CopG family ribbon-helix-helix protein [Thermohalobaculum sp.]|nr:CopG family ribbon-helix-helix protein [Thermohalobaculum sp.]